MLAGFVYIALVFRGAVFGIPSESAPSVAPVSKTNASSDLLQSASDEDAVLFQVKRAVCSSHATCRFSLQEKFPTETAERLKGTTIHPHEPCVLNDMWTSCCKDLGVELHQNLSTLHPSVDIKYLWGLARKLKDAKCQIIFCVKKHCIQVQCSQLASCSPETTSTLWMSASTTSSFSFFSGTSDVIGTSDVSNGKGGDAAANAGGAETRKTTIIIIVVSCLLAFLAGLGGAFLLICLRRRWRKGAQSQTTDAASSDHRGRELGALGTNTAPSQSKDVAHRHNHHYTSPTPNSVSSSTSDKPPTKHHTPPAAHTTPNISRHVGHLQNRKLPTAHALPVATQPLAGKMSRDQRARVGNGMFSENSKARRQERERQEIPNPTSEATKRERTPAGASGRDECYSSLKMGGGRAEDSEYTALNLAEADEKKDVLAAEENDAEASHDYLDVVPDYELSKPIR